MPYMQNICQCVAITAIIVMSLFNCTYIYAQQNAISIFSNQSLWAKLPSANAAHTAWSRGAKLKERDNSAVLYQDGFLYGYTATRIPVDADKAMQGKLNENYASRAEIRNIHALGITAFNDFQCGALADYATIQPDIRQCSDMKFSSKVTGADSGQAFSIASLSAHNVCSCRKALD
jgi:hypothetical protein